MLILKYTVEHKEFFAFIMHMGRKMTPGRVADDARGSRYLVPDAIEHPPVDAGYGRGDPG